MSRRKSAVSIFGDLTGGTSTNEAAPSPPPRNEARPKRKKASVIGATARTLGDIREERERLLRAVSESQGVVALDPSAIDPSPVADRLPDDNDAAFEALKATLEAEGQKLPILVRPHPDAPDRYQVVYGHRRTRALRELGRTVQAQVLDYSDRDLLVAQGIENANRQDLTWIEKALFASRMQAAGLKPRDVIAALGVDHSELSKYRAVTNALPSDVLEAIGRAPKAGRPRWRELIGAVSGDAEVERIREAVASAEMRDKSSDERFAAALATLTTPTDTKRSRKPRPERPIGAFGTARFGKSDVKIVLRGEHAEGFKTFLAERLDALADEYERHRSEE